MVSDRELVNMARQAVNNAYAPYSGFCVGAAVLAQDGEVYTGCNIENASYGATVCAERVAVSKCISEGARLIRKIAICSSGQDQTFPCGICRQVLSEFMEEDGEVLLGTPDGDFYSYTIGELLPNSFSLGV
jgi:cytidine deaminase